jgi:hypothetical protein
MFQPDQVVSFIVGDKVWYGVVQGSWNKLELDCDEKVLRHRLIGDVVQSSQEYHIQRLTDSTVSDYKVGDSYPFVLTNESFDVGYELNDMISTGCQYKWEDKVLQTKIASSKVHYRILGALFHYDIVPSVQEVREQVKLGAELFGTVDGDRVRMLD